MGVPTKGALIADNSVWDEGPWTDEGASNESAPLADSGATLRSVGKLALLCGTGYLTATASVVVLYDLMPAAPLPVLVGASVLAVSFAFGVFARRLISAWWWAFLPIVVFVIGIPVVGIASLVLLVEVGLVDGIFA